MSFSSLGGSRVTGWQEPRNGRLGRARQVRLVRHRATVAHPKKSFRLPALRHVGPSRWASNTLLLSMPLTVVPENGSAPATHDHRRRQHGQASDENHCREGGQCDGGNGRSYFAQAARLMHHRASGARVQPMFQSV